MNVSKLPIEFDDDGNIIIDDLLDELLGYEYDINELIRVYLVENFPDVASSIVEVYDDSDYEEEDFSYFVTDFAGLIKILMVLPSCEYTDKVRSNVVTIALDHFFTVENTLNEYARLYDD